MATTRRKTGKQVQLALNRKKWCQDRPLIKMYALVHNRTNNKNTPEIKMPRGFLFGPTFVGVHENCNRSIP